MPAPLLGPAAPPGLGRLGRRLEAVVARAAAGRADAAVVWVTDGRSVPSMEDAAADVVVSVGALSDAPDPARVLDDLARVTRHHLVVAERRAPFHRLARPAGRGRAWRSPQLVRLTSRVAAVRDIDHPWPWTVVWLAKY